MATRKRRPAGKTPRRSRKATAKRSRKAATRGAAPASRKRAAPARAPARKAAPARRVGQARKPVPARKPARARKLPSRQAAPTPQRQIARGARARAGAAPPLPAFTTLRLGSRGEAVVRLQQRLTELGFPTGAIDGLFGHGTESAVMAFQFSEELLTDGVAGPRTLTALGLMNDARLPSATGALDVQVVSAMCPGAPFANIRRYLPAIIEAMTEAALVDRTMLLMAVATICAETGRFCPLDEYRSRYNTSPNARAPYFDLYDHRRDLGNRGPGDGARYKGRGFVQLTGRANYERYGRALGLGDALLTAPDRANEPLIAARVLARFLKDRELAIKQALLERDFARARRLVNGGRHGLPEFTASYLAGESSLPEIVDAAPLLA